MFMSEILLLYLYKHQNETQTDKKGLKSTINDKIKRTLSHDVQCNAQQPAMTHMGHHTTAAFANK